MIIFLHGALGSAAQFDTIKAQMPDWAEARAINLPGHGGQPTEEPFSAAGFAKAVLEVLDKNQTEKARIFGYSMGGYVALWLAWKFPERVQSVLTYGTKLAWNPEVAAGMCRMFDPEKIELKAPQMAENLAKTHGDGQWKDLCRRTADFLLALGDGHGVPDHAFAHIHCPVVIGWGDADQVVTQEESMRVASVIPAGRLEILAGGKHLLEQTSPEQLAAFIRRNL